MSRVRIEEVLHDDGLGPDGAPEWEHETPDAPSCGRQRPAGPERLGLPPVDIDLVSVSCGLSESGTCAIEARLEHVSWVGRTPIYIMMSVAAPHELGGEAGVVEALGGRVCGRIARRLRIYIQTAQYRPGAQPELREWAASVAAADELLAVRLDEHP